MAISERLLNAAENHGRDEEYLNWLRRMPSALTGEYSEWVNGEGRCEAAHVRRSSNSGTGIKPPYCAIPLTHLEHAMTHKRGEQSIESPEWFENKAREYLKMWINGIRPPEPVEYKQFWERSYIVTHPGKIVGLWILAKDYFKNFTKPLKITIQPFVKSRSDNQNKAQWGLMYQHALDYYAKHPDQLAIDSVDSLKIGANKDYIHEMFKRLFNDGKSTARLNTIQSAEYAEKIRRHFLQKPEPYEIPEPKKHEESDDIY